MKIKQCKDCGREVITPKAQRCDQCSDRRTRENKKAATLRFREKNGLIKPKEAKVCSKCHQLKTEFYKGHAQCKECYRAYLTGNIPAVAEPVKRIEDDLPSGDLFWSLMQRAQSNPGIKNRKVRQSTVDRTLEVERTRNCNLIGELQIFMVVGIR